jgi:hypothetical protein
VLRKLVAQLKVSVVAHGYCFDGLTSAALFTKLRQSLSDDDFVFSYRSCGYSPSLKTVPDKWLSGDENAIVDFRYAPSKRLHWYFDHHVTAFGSEKERARSHLDDGHMFYEPTYTSCAKLIADRARDHFDVDLSSLDGLIGWADRIDSANFASPEEAINRSDPVMQLASVIENHGDTTFYRTMVPRLLTEPLSAIVRSDEIQDRWAPLSVEYQAVIARIGEACELRGEVVYADLHAHQLPGSGKFVSYALFPNARYSVTLLRTKRHFKVSVGYNPWSQKSRKHDIAAICSRYGGGGHPMVGAVAIGLDRAEHAIALAVKITEELNGTPPTD